MSCRLPTRTSRRARRARPRTRPAHTSRPQLRLTLRLPVSRKVARFLQIFGQPYVIAATLEAWAKRAGAKRAGPSGLTPLGASASTAALSGALALQTVQPRRRARQAQPTCPSRNHRFSSGSITHPTRSLNSDVWPNRGTHQFNRVS